VAIVGGALLSPFPEKALLLGGKEGGEAKKERLRRGAIRRAVVLGLRGSQVQRVRCRLLSGGLGKEI